MTTRETIIRLTFYRQDGTTFHSAARDIPLAVKAVARRFRNPGYVAADLVTVEREVGTWSADTVIRRQHITAPCNR